LNCPYKESQKNWNIFKKNWNKTGTFLLEDWN